MTSRSCRSRSPLARVMPPEMTCRAVFFPPRSGTVLMPLIVEDDYYEIIREFTIPDRSVSSMTQAGSWSARNSRSGFVPSTVLADITDDPDRDAGPWIAAGVVKRAKGGVRFVGGRGMTVVNAADIAAKKVRDRASANERQQRRRERLKAEQAGKIHAALPVTGVTRQSRPTNADVTGGKTGKRRKPQVSASNVTRDIGVTSRVTPGPSRAGARGLDFDFNQREENQVSQSGVPDAGPREDEPAPGSPEFRLQVIAEFAGATGDEIDDATADSLAAEVLGKATEPVPHPLGYVRRAILKERDPRARWLPQRPVRAPLAERAPHCGDPLCSPKTRRREHPETGADAGPCPKCSGSAATWKAS